MRILLCCLFSIGLTFLLHPSHVNCAVIAGTSHFPASVGSSWNFNTQTLTLTATGQTMMWGTEAVQVMPSGSFHSVITLPNGNSVTSDNNYVNLGQSIHINDTVITIKTVDVVPTPPLTFWTETTTVNSYSPTQVVFPASTALNTFETTTSTGTTNLTETMHVTAPYVIDQTISQIVNITTQVVDVTVGPAESVTVPAGTFQAIKITKVFTITEGGTTNPYTAYEWYAAGVGLVKMSSTNMNRELTSYNVIPVTTQLLTVTFQGTGGGSVHSAPAGISCSSGATCPSAPFNSGEIVTLTADADVNSTFTGWSGEGCSGTGTCVVTMDAAKNVSAGFDLLPARIFILGSPTPYQLMQLAYDAAVDNDTLQPLAEVFAEDPLTFRHSVNIVLAGGYDAGFLNQTGFTTIQGQVIFQLGSVVVDRLAIR